MLPPLLGALIGYITNKLAILMLFRPLERKYLLSLPIPLTPGIIPRQRGDLARSIGRMVSRELITEEALKTHASSPGMRASLADALERMIESFLDTPLTQPSPNEQTISSDNKNELYEIVQNIAADREVSKALSGFLYNVIQGIDFGIPLKSLAGILETIHSNPDSLGQSVREWLEKIAAGETTLDFFLTDDILSSLEKGIKRELPAIGKNVVGFLEKPEIKKDLEIRGISFLRKVFQRFNGIQRFFITAGQYDITLEENMGEIIEDLTAYIGSIFEDNEKSGEIARALCKSIEDKRTASIAHLLTERNIKRITNAVVDISGILSSDRILESISKSDKVLRSSAITKYVTIDHIHHAVRGVFSLLEGKNRINQDTDIHFSSSLLIEHAKGKALRSVFPVSSDSVSSLAHYISRNLLQLVEKRSKEIIEALDIYTLVVNKINSLDIASVERLLLQVIEKHLKWINLFGALLGALIGGIQIVLRIAGI